MNITKSENNPVISIKVYKKKLLVAKKKRVDDNVFSNVR